MVVLMIGLLAGCNSYGPEWTVNQKDLQERELRRQEQIKELTNVHYSPPPKTTDEEQIDEIRQRQKMKDDAEEQFNIALADANSLNDFYKLWFDVTYGSQYGWAGTKWSLFQGKIITRRRQWYVDKIGCDSQAKRQLILEGKICLTMTKDEVVASWGNPYDINRTVGSWGVHEQWVYGGDISNRKYLYFENGVLTSWQD
jgi:hypothetical protein